MEPSSPKRILLPAILGITLTFCVGGSSRADIVKMVTVLNGEQVPLAVPSLGVGKFTIDTGANTLAYDISFAGLTAGEIGAHIHGVADPGVDAGVLHTLPAGNPKTGVWNYSEPQEADILSGRTYVNIHTGPHVGGEIRGQIVSLVAVLDGAAAGTVSSGTGTGLFVIDTVANTLSYYVTFSGLSAAETGAHIHGYATHNAPAGVLHTLAAGSPKIGVWNYPDADESKILDGLTYVNVHSGTFPGGEIRGQITNNVTFLDGLQAGVSTTAYGFGDFSMDTAGDVLGYHTTHQGLSSAETAAHIHGFAARGVPAGILHTLALGTPKVGTWTYNPGDEPSIQAGLTYVNVHTTSFPGGEIRGQIEPITVIFLPVRLWELY